MIVLFVTSNSSEVLLRDALLHSFFHIHGRDHFAADQALDEVLKKLFGKTGIYILSPYPWPSFLLMTFAKIGFQSIDKTRCRRWQSAETVYVLFTALCCKIVSGIQLPLSGKLLQFCVACQFLQNRLNYWCGTAKNRTWAHNLLRQETNSNKKRKKREIYREYRWLEVTWVFKVTFGSSHCTVLLLITLLYYFK